MKTLADFKRRIVEGLEFTCEHHLRPEDGGKRTVTKVQTNGFYYVGVRADGTTFKGEFWTEYPKAKNVVIGENEVHYLVPGTMDKAFTYRFTEAA